MHPALLSPRGLGALLIASLLAGLGAAAWLAALGIAAWYVALLWTTPLALTFGLGALSLYPLCRNRPWRAARWIQDLSARAAALLALALVTTLLAAAWNALGLVFEHERGWVVLPPAAWGLLFAVSIALYLIAMLAHEVLIAEQRAREAAAQATEAQLLAREMELQVLRMQIDPHFLFNSLNSISALTSFDPKAARDMTLHLAQFFRQTLALGERERIRLDDELELVEHFLAVEQQRLGDKLRTAFEIEPECRDALLPPLLLQPLVENAIKHGLRQRDEGGLLRVRALRREGWLHLSVDNPLGEPSAAPASGLGLGLRNLQQRLLRLYGERASVQWGPRPDGFAVNITLPYES